MKKLLTLAVLAFALTGCASTDYTAGVAANKEVILGHQKVQLVQQLSIITCFKSPEMKDKSMCAILAAGTNPTQVLGGKPDGIRVADTLLESGAKVLGKGVEGVVAIQGIRSTADTVKKLGTPIEVRPEVVKPEIVLVPAVF